MACSVAVHYWLSEADVRPRGISNSYLAILFGSSVFVSSLTDTYFSGLRSSLILMKILLFFAIGIVCFILLVLLYVILYAQKEEKFSGKLTFLTVDGVSVCGLSQKDDEEIQKCVGLTTESRLACLNLDPILDNTYCRNSKDLEGEHITVEGIRKSSRDPMFTIKDMGNISFVKVIRRESESSL